MPLTADEESLESVLRKLEILVLARLWHNPAERTRLLRGLDRIEQVVHRAAGQMDNMPPEAGGYED